MRDIKNIVVLTGAGISAETGLKTFRGPDGLWEGHRVEDVATPQAFARDPALVQKFYEQRRRSVVTRLRRLGRRGSRSRSWRPRSGNW